MKALLDTCVLYPTVMRQMLLGAADAGFFVPLWSERILGELVRATDKLGPAARAQAEREAVALRLDWPGALVTPPEDAEAGLWLPDPADVHVLAAAVAGGAEVLVTVNARDFPARALAEQGLSRADPDPFLLGFQRADPAAMAAVAREVLARARGASGEAWDVRTLMKKARLPRLGKALEKAEG